MDQTLLNFVLALIANELLHNALEVMNMREKLKRLQAYMDKKPYKEFPLNINTRAKSYAISALGFLVFVAPLFGLFTWLNLSPTTALKTMLMLLIITYALTAVTVDRFHVEIERITRPFMKRR